MEKKFLKNKEALNEMIMSVNNYVSFLASEPEEKIKIKNILDAMRVVDRLYYVENKEEAYLDEAKPIGSGQTISQPSTVARMLMLLELEPGLNILEVGSGSGWHAALIAFLVRPGKIVSTEIIPQLAQKAKNNFQTFKDSLPPNIQKEFGNIEFRAENIFSLKKHMHYDRIMFTAGITELQEHKIENFAKKFLKENGILLCPYQAGPFMVLKKTNEHFEKKYTAEYYSFVPLIN